MFFKIRNGFTLIEMLVVIMAIGVLVALLLPAIQSAREAARRAACAGNLKQIGIAIHSYASAHGVLPPGNAGRGYSLHAMILPFMEEGALYASINFSVPAIDSSMASPNMTSALVAVHSFICPSDVGGQWVYGSTNYAGNRGTGYQKYGYNGAFSADPVSLGAITDGASNTTAISEWVRSDPNLNSTHPLRSIYHTTKSFFEAEELDRFAQVCRDLLDVQENVLNEKGLRWLRGEYKSTLYNHVLGINSSGCTNAGSVQVGAYSAGSQHPGGAHALFCDGHARYIKASVSLPVWRSLGSRDGREIVPQDAY